MPTLHARDLRKTYKGRAVVDGVSIDVAPGEIVGLLGPNGAGKTTSFYMMVGLVRPDAGRVLLDDRDITRLPMHERARAGLGYLAQEPSAFRKLSAGDNILLVLEMQPGLGRKEQLERRDELLEGLSLTNRRDSLAQTLSGGERRRVEIARVLATRPQFILLDEPFTGVDPLVIEDLQSIIHDLKRQGIGILITEHHVQATLQITDRAYILADGKIVTQGTPREIAADDIARRYYLGETTAQFLLDDLNRRVGGEE